MAWQPQDGPVQELAGYLRESLVTRDPAARNHAAQMLQQASSTSPDINNYLCYILVNPAAHPTMPPSEYNMVRCSAATLMKNNIATVPASMSSATLPYVKAEVLKGLRDSDTGVRNFTGNVVTELLKKLGVMGSSDMLTMLISMVEGTDGHEPSVSAQEGAMGALKKYCQDSKRLLDKVYDGQRPLDFLIPKFLHFTQHPSHNVRADALEVLNLFLPQKSPAIVSNLDTLVGLLFQVGSDDHRPIRREVCRALVHLVDIKPETLAPVMGGVVDYMLEQQKTDEDPDLPLDAAEFWLTVGEHEGLRPTLGPHLHKIVPVLLRSMVYAPDDIERLGGAGEDADEEDKAEDLKPVFAKAKQRLPNGQNVEVPEEVSRRNGEEGELSDGEVDEWDSDFDDILGDDDPEDRWNLRKCSAAALDVLATVFHENVLGVILPYLKETLRHPEWPFREAAVLALGAVAEGCLGGVAPHLPELVPYLISLLNDPEPLVRQITCWTLGRYSRWAAQLQSHEDRHKYFEPMMEGILLKMLDGNKRVQEAAASAFANLEEQSREVLTPYIKPILSQFVMAMQRYKDRNMFILYDCIQTLAEHVGEALGEEEPVTILMPALIERWKKVRDDARELFPLLECLSYVSTALRHSFAPFAQPIFNRCITIIAHNLEYQQAFIQGRLTDEPDKDFLVTSLDLLSAVIQALDTESAPLVASANPNFFQLLAMCMNDTSNDVRQSSYALLGDCAIYVFAQLQQYLPQVMECLIRQLDISGLDEYNDDNRYSVINNACWSCGEISLQQGSSMAPYIEKLYDALLNILQSPKVPSSVTENAAVALGRLGLGSCEELAPFLETFAYPFLDSLAKVVETDEKDTALKGFCMVVGRNPEAMESCLIPFFKAIARYREPSAELRELFKQTVNGYNGFIADFNSFVQQLTPQDQVALQHLMSS